MLWLTIPMTVLLPAWLWFGRIVFGVGGWGLFLLLPVAVVLALLLVITTALAFTQDGATRGLTGSQAGATLALWVSVLATGAVVPDFGDTDDSRRSLLTQAFGYSDDLYDLSFLLALAGGAAILVAWVVLLVSLTAGRRKIVA